MVGVNEENELEIVHFGQPDYTVVLRPVFEAENFGELEERFTHGERPEAWRRAGLWALAEMRALLGEDWLGDTAASGWFPAELGAAYSHTREYVRLLELALRLRQFAGARGIGRLRDGLKSDRRVERWLHTSLQLEVAALAASKGAAASFESRDQSLYPADVRLATDDLTIAVEAFAVLTSERWRAGVDASDAISDRVRAIEQRHGVTCAVDFAGEELDRDKRARFLDEIELGAVVVAAGQPLHVARAGRVNAVVTRSGEQRVIGPPIAENPWRRIAARVTQKREQTRVSKERVWLRVDLLGGIWQFSAWSQAPLGQKLSAFTTQLRHEFSGDIGQVAGVVASSGPLLAQGRFTDETVRALDGSSALRRVIKPARVRETLIVPFGPDSLPAGHFFRDLYADEPDWLDGALAGHGLGATAAIFPPIGSS